MKKRKVRIEGGYVYKGIEKSTGEEVLMTLIGGQEPKFSVIDENRCLHYTEVTILEKVGDSLEENLGK